MKTLEQLCEEMARLAQERLPAAERLRAQASITLWGLRSMPVARSDFARGPLTAWSRAVAAVEEAARGGETAPPVSEAFGDWVRGFSTDWATGQSLESLGEAVARVLSPSDWGLGAGETDLVSTCEEVIRAAGMWDWDESLTYCYFDFGSMEKEYWAQEIRRDEAQDAARAAIVEILRAAE